MASEESVHNLYDLRLRPRLLQSIMATHLPDEKHLTKSPSQLSSAVSLIRRHRLLSESIAGGGSKAASLHGGKSLEGRKSVVDAWVDRVSVLLSSHAENRWAGVSLLGVTSQECSLRRFIDSYASWLQKLAIQLKSTEPAFVRAAACASLTDIFTRLGALLEFPGIRRDAAALAGKLSQPLIQILSDNESSSIWNDAVDLLCAVLKSFPASLRQQYNVVEGLLVAQLMDVECNSKLSQKCALSLALLPRAHGEASAWSSMIRQILTAINTELDDAFVGMEDPKTPEILLVRNQEPPWPLGGFAITSTASVQVTKRFWQQLVPRVSSLVHCCHFLLVKPYPVPVHVPMTPLLALVSRILHVDGSRVPAISPLGVNISTAQQLALCCELPTLHGCALDLLNATICGARSQLLPQAAEIVQLLTDCFRQSGVTSTRLKIKLYNLVRHLLVGMGAGMAEALAPVVVGNALPDLKVPNPAMKPFSPKGVLTSRTINPSGLGGAWCDSRNQRKRKEPGGLPVDQASILLDESGVTDEGSTPIPVQIAALEALEALLTAGGSLLPERVRMEIDTLLASVAVTVSTRTVYGSITYDEETASIEGSISMSSSSLQMAAYRALLASLLSPCNHRPPFLAQGLALFRRGRKEVGTEVAEVCAHAILALEPLIHPRCLPPAVTPAATLSSVGTGKSIPTGNIITNVKRSGKPGPGFGAVGNIPTIPTAQSFGSSLVPPFKVSHLAVDPWAEVDTWLGYGEDLAEDWSRLFIDDINNEELVANIGVADTQFKADQDGDKNQPAISYVEALTTGDVETTGLRMNSTTGTVETTGLRMNSQVNSLSVGTLQDISHAEVGKPDQLCMVSQRAMSESVIGVTLRENAADLSNQVDVNLPANFLGKNLEMETGSSHFNNPKAEEDHAVKSSISLVQDSNVEAIGNNSPEVEMGMEKAMNVVASGISFPSLTGLKTPEMNISPSPNSAIEIKANSDSDSDFIPEIVDGDPDSDYSA
ncbi:hypothetical protein O6H91_20G021200 [Diphasiastrum complanatum]|uniref:Uncharacterized protein n=1 Tax=Diphasiastrum complanatum TaxID=34168 RepID=A0ACC2AND5_DIPCM|nr:hypothetical protein O6H91_20G021200 [Diphasiastrum complanatum]